MRPAYGARHLRGVARPLPAAAGAVHAPPGRCRGPGALARARRVGGAAGAVRAAGRRDGAGPRIVPRGDADRLARSGGPAARRHRFLRQHQRVGGRSSGRRLPRLSAGKRGVLSQSPGACARLLLGGAGER
ncbi:hypothetical protein G6F35_015237 [Rhizopus arrhizus]|nr:hypothetical protein G6F35_015237 [Rhizopus arrhizus]